MQDEAWKTETKGIVTGTSGGCPWLGCRACAKVLKQNESFCKTKPMSFLATRSEEDRSLVTSSPLPIWHAKYDTHKVTVF
jgi:hypothetical protein